MPERGRFGEEFLIEGGAVDLATLEERPCVGVWVSGIDPSNEILGKTTTGLIAIERLEGGSGENAAEIPNYRIDTHAIILFNAIVQLILMLRCFGSKSSSNQPLRNHGHQYYFIPE